MRVYGLSFPTESLLDDAPDTRRGHLAGLRIDIAPAAEGAAMTDLPDPPLTRDEIYLGDPVNPGVARLVLQEASAHLADLLDVKKQFETKAAVLLAALVTIAVAIIGSAVFGSAPAGVRQWLWVSGVGFGLASGLCMWALRDQQYGTPGVRAGYWSTAYWIRHEDPAAADRLAAIFAIDIEDQVKRTMASNKSKLAAIRWAIRLTFVSGLIAAAVAACVAFSADPSAAAASPAAKAAAVEAAGSAL
jgi:hypothetical protein